MYHLLTYQDRLEIQRLLPCTNPDKLAKIIGVDRATIYREIKRGRTDRGYNAMLAQKVVDRSMKNKGRHPAGKEENESEQKN
ncbi:MAG: helix-turn-helix domain-containing protein [Lachnospiraceae bacterium]|nr:helix-turn-helix domain-containing protein [Lachnospiraceae bacterium]